MRFDYYSATLAGSVSHCQAAIISRFGGFLNEDKPVNGYKFALRSSETDARLYWGGHNPLPFIVVSGDTSPDVTAFIRETYPGHRVSRVDVAEDFVEAGGFDRVSGLIDPIARRARAEVTFIGDPDPASRKGRTLYFGSAKSDVRLVLYEKGLHQRGRGEIGAPEDWCRLELRVRPRKARKALCASLSECQLWGMARWSQTVADQVLGSVTEYVPDASLRRAKADQSLAHMLRQYASVIRAYVDLHDKDALFNEINEVLEDA